VFSHLFSAVTLITLIAICLLSAVYYCSVTDAVILLLYCFTAGTVLPSCTGVKLLTVQAQVFQE